jgi:hypothetical protein
MADAQHQGELQWQAFPAGESGFFRAPVLLSATREALLLDGGFTLSDGQAVAEVIKRAAKVLQAVYVSQSDPDYYFGLGPIKAAFPDAQVIAAPATVAAIQSSVQKKLEAWGPQLGDNGPKGTRRLFRCQVIQSTSSMRSGCPIAATSGCPRCREYSAACCYFPVSTYGRRTHPGRTSVRRGSKRWTRWPHTIPVSSCQATW